MVVTVSPRLDDVRETVSSLTLAKRVRSIELGGAKREVENKEYSRISQEHERKVEALKSRISALEAQLRNALGAAKATQDDRLKRSSVDTRKRAEERKLWCVSVFSVCVCVCAVYVYTCV